MTQYIGIAEAVRLSGIPRATVTRWIRASTLGLPPTGGVPRRARHGDLCVYPALGAVKMPGRRWQFSREICEVVGARQSDPLNARDEAQHWLASLVRTSTRELESAHFHPSAAMAEGLATK